MLAARRYLGDLRRFGPNVARYFVAVALVGFAIDGGIYAALLNLYLARIGYGPEQIGLVNAAGALVFAVASLPAGLLGERRGSRPIMLIGLGLLAGGGALLPLADAMPAAARMPWLLATISGLYIGLALYFVNGAPVLLGLIRPDQRNQAYGTQTALIALSAFLGSLIGGLLPPLIGGLIGAPLDTPAPYRYGLIIAGLALSPGLLAISALPSAELHEQPGAPAAAPAAAPASAAAPIGGLLTRIALVRIIQLSGLATVSTFLNLYLDTALRVPIAQIGLILALGRLAGVPAALLTSSMSARFSNRRVVIATSLATGVGMLPLALIPHWSAAALSMAAVFAFSAIRYASSMVYFLDMVPASRRATVVGVTEMSAGVCFTAFTYGGGYIIALLGYQALFLLSAGLSALSALAFWGLFKRKT